MDPLESSDIPVYKAMIEEAHRADKADIKKASQDKEDLKQMHNNYFLQVQTLINQKAIEAPGEKKKWWKF